MILRVSPVTGLVRDVSFLPRAVRSSQAVGCLKPAHIQVDKVGVDAGEYCTSVLPDTTAEPSPPMITTYMMYARSEYVL